MFLNNGTVDTSRVKPELVALGQSVASTVFFRNQSQYLDATGNSISAAAVAGAVAVLWSAVPGLQRKVEETTQLLLDTANPKPSTDCTGPAAGHPNNVFWLRTDQCCQSVRQNSEEIQRIQAAFQGLQDASVKSI